MNTYNQRHKNIANTKQATNIVYNGYHIIMTKPLFDYNNPLRCSGNRPEVLDKFRKNYDLIMSLPQETKEERNFAYCIWLAEKERERILPDIHPAIPQSHLHPIH